MTLEVDGYAIADRVLAPHEVDVAAAALDEVFAAEDDVALDRAWSTPVYRVAYALPVKHQVFLGLCLHPELLALARSVLGDDCVVAGFNGIDLVPHGERQALHRDHPEPMPGQTLYLHVVCALDRFTAANGGTIVAPGTQRGEPIDELRTIELEPGGAVAFDGAIVHAAGANTTDGRRRALHLFYGRRFVQPHWDWPASFSAEAASTLDDEQRQVLGFTGRPRRWDGAQRRTVR